MAKYITMKVVAALFCLGMYSMISQMLIVRELLIIVSGNELSIGIVIGLWLALTGTGAWTASAWSDHLTRRQGELLLGGILLWLASLLPIQIVVARVARDIVSIPAGEYASIGHLLIISVGLLAPTCLANGVAFIIGCRLASLEDKYAVRHVYLGESLGAVLGGILFSFGLAGQWHAFQIVLFASLLLLAVSIPFWPWRTMRWSGYGLAAILLVLLIIPTPRWHLERVMAEARWRSFGILSRGQDGTARVIASIESRYQNITVIGTPQQYTLYGNGEVVSVFPDPIYYEHTIHFIMAQYPTAHRVLLLGGNPMGAIPELCRYPICELVFVESDPGFGQIFRQVAENEYLTVVSDPRVRVRSLDGPRFVKLCREQFDVIIVQAPEPLTAANNRYYTVEFFADVKRILAPDGFLYTSIESSERLGVHTAQRNASIYRSLRAVYEIVLVTAGSPMQFFASRAGSQLTFKPQELYQRSAAAKLNTRYFRPEYLLKMEEIDDIKTALTRNRLAQVPAPLNTADHPISYYYSLILWSIYSGSHLEIMLERLPPWMEARRGWVWIAGATLVFAIGMGGWFARRKKRRAQRNWLRLTVLSVMFLAGYSAITLEIILVLNYQNLFGYLYTMLGFIMAMFMFGLIMGAETSRHWDAARLQRCLLSLMVCELVLALVAMGSAWVVNPVLTGAWTHGKEIAIYLLVLLTGWTSGLQFMLISQVLQKLEQNIGRNVSLVAAMDNLGAAFGSLITVIISVPIFGVQNSCRIIIVFQAVGVLLLVTLMVFLARVQPQD